MSWLPGGDLEATAQNRKWLASTRASLSPVEQRGLSTHGLQMGQGHQQCLYASVFQSS